MRLKIGTHVLAIRAPDERGAGPAILFLHGAGGASAAFLAAARKLRGRADAYLLDFPAHGGSPAEVEPNQGHERKARTAPVPSIEGFADLAAAAAMELAIVPFVAVGHSMGAAVAVQLALSRPEIVRGLGLVCAELPLRVHPRLRAALGGPSARVAEVFAEIGHSPRTPEHVRRANAAPIAATNPRVLEDDLAACDRYDPTAQLAGLRVPTVVVAGADDAITPVEGSRRLAERIPGARLVVVEAAGHMLPVEQPGPLAEAIASLLSSVLGP